MLCNANPKKKKKKKKNNNNNNNNNKRRMVTKNIEMNHKDQKSQG